MSNPFEPADDRIFLVYPERRWVSPYLIESWFADAVADGIIVRSPDDPAVPNLDEMCSALEDVGHITRGRP